MEVDGSCASVADAQCVVAKTYNERLALNDDRPYGEGRWMQRERGRVQ